MRLRQTAGGNVLGNWKAALKASAIGPVPRAAAISISRAKPSTRLISVPVATVANFRIRLIRRPWLATGACAGLARRWRAVPSSVAIRPLLDAGKARRVVDLLAGQVGDVEGVDDLFAEGGDVGRGNVERQIGQRTGDLRQQAGSVEALDLDDREAVGERVADLGARLDPESPGAALAAWRASRSSRAASLARRARPRSAGRPARRGGARPRRDRTRGRSGSCRAPGRPRW